MGGDGVGTTPKSGPPPSIIQTQKPFVAFKTDAVPPSQFVYMQLNDVILLRTLSNVNNTLINIFYRYLTPEGEIKEGLFIAVLQTTIQVNAIPVMEGWLLSIGMQAQTAYPVGGWGFVQVSLARGSNPLAFVLNTQGMIWEGYVPASAATGWPGTPAQRIMDGPGVFRSITGTTPAAGAEITETVPANRRWILLGWRPVLTTSAAVANRLASLSFRDNNNLNFFIGPSYFNQVASTVIGYSVMNALPAITLLGGDQPQTAPVPTPLKAGFKIVTLTGFLQAGDQYSAPEYTVLEWGSWDS